jgi:phthalate 4,5-cis-dihydrodiol dehydrogenase
MGDRKLRLGVAGLGRAFTLMLPTFVGDSRVELVAASDPRAEARRLFERQFAGRTYGTVEALCGDPAVEAIYIATPHQFHARHACLAAACGKHMLVEKPMALTLDDCRAMIDAARNAGVQIVVGHSHSFDAPVLRARAIIDSGDIGQVRMIHAMNYTDFLYRPRRPEELDTAKGGGVVFSQAAHQIDIVRLLGGGRLKTVRAATGAWDPARPTEGAYAALLFFEDGAFGSVIYGGYAHFDSDEFMGWIGEMGQAKDPALHGRARAILQQSAARTDETGLKNSRAYGGEAYTAPDAADPRLHQHFGPVVVSCERADLRPLPTGVMIHDDRGARLEPLPRPTIPRAEVIDELYDAAVEGRAPLHSGEWAMATVEICLALLRSARQGRDIALLHQVGLPAGRRGR